MLTLRRSIECNPKEAYGWNGAGVCLEALGKDGGECFKVAKGMSSDNEEGWLNAVVRDYRRGEDVESSLDDLTGVSEHALSWLVRGLDLRRKGLKGGDEAVLTAAKTYLKDAVGRVEGAGEDAQALERWRRIWRGMGGQDVELEEEERDKEEGERVVQESDLTKEWKEVVDLVERGEETALPMLKDICMRSNNPTSYAGEMRALKAWVERDVAIKNGDDERARNERFKREVQLAAVWAPTSEFVRAALLEI